MKWFLYRVFSNLLELLVKAVIATFDPPGVAVAQEEERFGTNWKDGGLIPGSYSLPWTGYWTPLLSDVLNRVKMD